MLTQYRLYLELDRDCIPKPEWGYKLYSALLEKSPVDFGEQAHIDGVTPVSQFFFSERVDQAIWIVTLLGNQAEEKLIETLETLETLHLNKDRITLAVQKRHRMQIDDADELLSLAKQHNGFHPLQFRTPTAFKSRGQYLNLPTPRLIVQSLIKKWNGCILECPIDDENNEGMEALAAGLRFRAFQIQNQMYYLKGSSIPGFSGTILMENRLSGFHRQLLDALLLFAGYSGIGIKTTLGMGGVVVKTTKNGDED